jgi:hypothetical protein
MRRRAAPGPDKVTWRQYRIGLDERLDTLGAALRSDTWRQGPLRECLVRSFAGATFSVAIPNVEDRIVHRAIRLTLEPLLEAFAFKDFVSGFRPRRNRLSAVRRAAEYLAHDYWVADIDVAHSAMFDDVEHIIDLVARYVSDGAFLRRVRRVLEGLPRPLQPGSGLTPLLINLLLVPVDEAAAHMRVVRFGDNYCVFSSSEAQALDDFTQMEHLLESHRLSINKSKSVTRSRPNAEDLFLLGE